MNKLEDSLLVSFFSLMITDITLFILTSYSLEVKNLKITCLRYSKSTMLLNLTSISPDSVEIGEWFNIGAVLLGEENAFSEVEAPAKSKEIFCSRWDVSFGFKLSESLEAAPLPPLNWLSWLTFPVVVFNSFWNVFFISFRRCCSNFADCKMFLMQSISQSI